MVYRFQQREVTLLVVVELLLATISSLFGFEIVDRQMKGGTEVSSEAEPRCSSPTVEESSIIVATGHRTADVQHGDEFHVSGLC